MSRLLRRLRGLAKRPLVDVDWAVVNVGHPLGPINAAVAQPPPIHFFSKFVGVLLHAVARKAIAPARLHIGLDLSSNVFVKRQ